jgi:hypothetical protein
MTLDHHGSNGPPALLITWTRQCPRCEGADIRTLRPVTSAHAVSSVCDSCGHTWLNRHTDSNKRHLDLYGRL